MLGGCREVISIRADFGMGSHELGNSCANGLIQEGKQNGSLKDGVSERSGYGCNISSSDLRGSHFLYVVRMFMLRIELERK